MSRKIDSMNIIVKLATFTELETSRLLLRPFRFEDAKAMYEYTSQPENLQYVFAPHFSLEETQYILATELMKAPLGKWAIELKKENKLIGDIHFVSLSEKKQCAEIGYVLNQAYWNQGYLTEALATLTAFSLEEFGLKNVTLKIDQTNAPSKRVAQKVGYQLMGNFKAASPYTGKIRDFEKYEASSANWSREKLVKRAH